MCSDDNNARELKTKSKKKGKQGFHLIKPQPKQRFSLLNLVRSLFFETESLECYSSLIKQYEGDVIYDKIGRPNL